MLRISRQFCEFTQMYSDGEVTRNFIKAFMCTYLRFLAHKPISCYGQSKIAGRENDNQQALVGRAKQDLNVKVICIYRITERCPRLRRRCQRRNLLLAPSGGRQAEGSFCQTTSTLTAPRHFCIGAGVQP